MLIRRDPHKEKDRVRLPIADLRLQTNIGQSFTELLELRNSLGFVYAYISFQNPSHPSHKHTRLRKAVANHIIDVQIALKSF